MRTLLSLAALAVVVALVGFGLGSSARTSTAQAPSQSAPVGLQTATYLPVGVNNVQLASIAQQLPTFTPVVPTQTPGSCQPFPNNKWVVLRYWENQPIWGQFRTIYEMWNGCEVKYAACVMPLTPNLSVGHPCELPVGGNELNCGGNNQRVQFITWQPPTPPQTPEPKPSASPSPSPSPSSSPTPGSPVTPVTPVVPTPDQCVPDARQQRIIDLDKTYRASGIVPWLNAGGVKGTIKPVWPYAQDETICGMQYANHIVVDCENCSWPWPVVGTTQLWLGPVNGGPAQVVNGRTLGVGLPEPGGSQATTDVSGFTGRVTLYVSASDWKPLDPATWSNRTACISMADLVVLNGNLWPTWVTDRNGIAGAQVKFTQNWTPPSCVSTVTGVSDPKSVKAGETGTVWVDSRFTAIRSWR